MPHPQPVPAVSGAPAQPSADELGARLAAVRAAAAAASLDGLLIFGNLASSHAIRYLTAWPPGWDSFLVVPSSGRPRLLVPSENHAPTARALAGEAANVSWAGPDAAAGVLAAIAETMGSSLRRVGLVGPLPYTIHGRLASMPTLVLSEADALFRAVRMVKVPAEIARARLAAAMADAAVETLLGRLGPGLRDWELAAIIQASYRAAGGEDGICFVASAPMAGGGRVVPAQVPSDRRLDHGDLVMFELSVGVGGDTSQVLRTITLGSPTPAVQRLHDVADAAFAAILERIRPGTSAADLLEAARVIDDAGLTVVDDVVHGYGGGYLPPVVRTPLTQRRPPPDLRLEPGMLLVIQPNVVDRDLSLGVQTGELVVVTPDGASTLHRLPRGLLQA